MQCHACDRERPDGERYCLRCGASLNPGHEVNACTVVI